MLHRTIDIIDSWISHPVVSWMVFLAVVGLFIWFVRFIIKRTEKQSAWNNGLTAIGEIKGDIKDIRNKFDVLYEKIFFSNPDLATKASPLALTKKGRKLADNIGSDKLIQKYADISGITEEMTAYAIQLEAREFAIHKLLELVTDEERANIDAVLYKKGLNKIDLGSLIGLPLRDLFIRKFNKDAALLDD